MNPYLGIEFVDPQREDKYLRVLIEHGSPADSEWAISRLFERWMFQLNPEEPSIGNTPFYIEYDKIKITNFDVPFPLLSKDRVTINFMWPEWYGVEGIHQWPPFPRERSGRAAVDASWSWLSFAKDKPGWEPVKQFIDGYALEALTEIYSKYCDEGEYDEDIDDCRQDNVFPRGDLGFYYILSDEIRDLWLRFWFERARAITEEVYAKLKMAFAIPGLSAPAKVATMNKISEIIANVSAWAGIEVQGASGGLSSKLLRMLGIKDADITIE